MTAPTPTKKTPAPSAHGWRITWPMVLGWLTAISLIAPVLLPYVMGEKKLDAAAASALLSVIVAALTHSPTPSAGGGLPRPPAIGGAATLLLVLLAGLTQGCGGGALQDGQVALGVAAQGVVASRAIVDTARSSDCGTEPTSDCLHAHGLDVLTDALATAYDAVVAGAAALRAATAQNALALWLAVAPCVVSAVNHLLTTMADAGVQVPPWLTDAVATLQRLAGPCGEAPATLALRAMGPR